MARGIALFLGAFTLLNLAGDLRFARASGNVWWIDFAPLPLPFARVVLALIAAALLWFALARPPRVVTLVAVTLVFVAAVANAVNYYVLLARRALPRRPRSAPPLLRRPRRTGGHAAPGGIARRPRGRDPPRPARRQHRVDRPQHRRAAARPRPRPRRQPLLPPAENQDDLPALRQRGLHRAV